MTSRRPVVAAVAVLAGLVAACQGAPASTPPSTGTATAAGAGLSEAPTTGASMTPGTTPSPSGPRPTSGPGGCSIAAPATAPSGLTLYVCYTISGSVSASGGFIDSDQGANALSCADWAQHGGEAPSSAAAALQAPDPGDAQVTVNGQGLDLVINPYSGPGSYPSTTVAQSVSLGAAVSWSTNSTKTATFTAQVSPDGSGSVTAGELANDSSNGTIESVSESWVCVMEPAS